MRGCEKEPERLDVSSSMLCWSSGEVFVVFPLHRSAVLPEWQEVLPGQQAEAEGGQGLPALLCQRLHGVLLGLLMTSLHLKTLLPWFHIKIMAKDCRTIPYRTVPYRTVP